MFAENEKNITETFAATSKANGMAQQPTTVDESSKYYGTVPSWGHSLTFIFHS